MVEHSAVGINDHMWPHMSYLPPSVTVFWAMEIDRAIQKYSRELCVLKPKHKTTDNVGKEYAFYTP